MTRKLARPAFVTLAALAALATNGCYWSSPPTTPHGKVELDPAKLPALAEETPPALKSRRVLVLGRFETVAVQPLGALYDHDDYSISPLYRTYFFRDAHIEIFEHGCDALRATGLDVRKDYQTNATPTLVEARVRALDPLLVSATITALQHDQIRLDADPPVDVEVARLTIDVVVRELSGRSRYARSLVIEGKLPHRDGADVLSILGRRLGTTLARDPEFLRAVEASS